MPCLVLIKMFILYLGVVVGDKLGVKFTTLLSITFIISAYVLLLFSNSIYLLLTGMVLSGLGDGIGSLSLVKNCWKYYPDNIGLVTGLIFTSVGLSASGVTILADYFIINPEKIPADASGIYPIEVSKNLPSFLDLLLKLYSVMCIISFFCTFSYSEEEDIDSKIKSVDNTSKDILPTATISSKDSIDLRPKYIEDDGSNFRDGFCSKRNFELSLFFYCGPCK